MSAVRGLRRHLPVALAVTLLVTAVILCGVSFRYVVHASSPLRPRPPTDHRHLAEEIDRLIAAPSGATMTLTAGEHELESFINYSALPRASLGVLRVALRLTDGAAQLTLLLGDTTPVMAVSIAQEDDLDSAGRLRLTGLQVGRIQTPSLLCSWLSRALNDTLAAGEVGVTLQSLALSEGEARVTITRR